MATSGLTVVYLFRHVQRLTSSPTEEILKEELLAASTQGQTTRIQALLEEWKSLDTSSEPPLYRMLVNATEQARLTTMSYLLNRGTVIATDVVYAAVNTGSTEVLQALVDGGFNINDGIGHAGDALILSISNPPLLRWLLPDPNANRCNTRSALECAIMRASTEVTELLLRHGAQLKNTSALKIAGYFGRTDMILQLLQHGVDINEISDNDEMMDAERAVGLGTALHEAAKNGQKAVVELLLEKGANPTLKDSLGKMALDLAKDKHHYDVVDVLSRAA